MSRLLGFFSVVRKPGDVHLTIRARAKDDLAALRQQYLPSLGEIVEGAGTDYPFRAIVSAEALAEAAGKMVLDINYSNFKSAVLARQGLSREEIYAQVWEALLGLEDLDPGSSGVSG